MNVALASAVATVAALFALVASSTSWIPAGAFYVASGVPRAIMSTLFDYSISWFARGSVGTAMGVMAAASNLGFLLGELIGGAVAENYGYRAVFLVASTCLAVIAPVLLLPRPEKPRRTAKAGLEIPRKAKALYAAYFARMLGASCFWTVYPLFLKALGASDSWIGLCYAADTLAASMISPLAGRISEKRYREVFMAGLVASIMAFTGFSLMQTPLEALPLGLVIGTSWALLFNSAIVGVTLESCEETRADAYAALNTTLWLSWAPGSLLGGALSQLYSYRTAAYAALALSTVALAMFVVGSLKQSK